MHTAPCSGEVDDFGCHAWGETSVCVCVCVATTVRGLAACVCDVGGGGGGGGVGGGVVIAAVGVAAGGQAADEGFHFFCGRCVGVDGDVDVQKQIPLFYVPAGAAAANNKRTSPEAASLLSSRSCFLPCDLCMYVCKSVGGR